MLVAHQVCAAAGEGRQGKLLGEAGGAARPQVQAGEDWMVK